MANESILIVEDNLSHAKLMRLLLTLEGYTIQHAARAEDVWPILEEFQPDLILMDIQLPGITGLDLTRQLKADPRYRSIIIIAITAYAMKHDRDVALAAGCADYITKPIDTVTLPALVRGYLDAYHP